MVSAQNAVSGASIPSRGHFSGLLMCVISENRSKKAVRVWYCYNSLSYGVLFLGYLVLNSCIITTVQVNQKPNQSYQHADLCRLGIGQRVTLTFDLLTSGTVHAEFLPQSACVSSLVLIPHAVFLLDCGHTHQVTDATDYPTHALATTSVVMND